MSILRNSAWNVAGVIVPTLFAIPALAVYARVLGVELLGLLTLTFAIVGYATSFDFGLSRALIREVAINDGDPVAIRTLMGTAAVAVGAISLLLAAVVAVGVPTLVEYLKVSEVNRDDTTAALYWLCASIPPYLLSLVATSYFEGGERFAAVNLIRTSSAAMNAVAGVAFVLAVPTLTAVLAALCLTRWIACVATFYVYGNEINAGSGRRALDIARFDRRALGTLVRYGSWLTVSNVIGPIMVYFDRFVLSNIVGARVVAFYTVPAEVVSRLSLFPSAVSKALFPRLSKQQVGAAADRRLGLFLTMGCTILTIAPVYVLAELILGVWMGAEYTGEPVTVLRILLVGFFFNALAFGPFTDLQARGHSRLTALIHLAELLPYLAILVALTARYGITGTALAWSLRTLVDSMAMLWFARRVR